MSELGLRLRMKNEGICPVCGTLQITEVSDADVLAATEEALCIRPIIEAEQSALAERDETIRSLRSRVEWQPIETVPDHDVLLFWPPIRSGQNRLPSRTESGRARDCLFRHPTHWMLLPDPPLQYVEGES